ncbi:ubiquitin-related domain-containing protein [Peziza echinospora]|nr:ubiquitin-related domain-containing protein [Peziza echinospora]
MGDYDNLVEMGFDARRVKLALQKTKGFNDAITWLAENEAVPIEELEAAAPAPAAAGSSSAAGADVLGEDGEGDGRSAEGGAKSLKCGECGKLFNTPAKAEYHATRTGHDQFEESTEVVKPLTEEEKAAKLAELKAKLAEKRANQSITDAKTQRANEAIRRKNDAESDRIKEDLRKREQLKEAEKRRQEKLDDAAAKEKIRAQIRADQENRLVKAQQEKAAREGRVVETSAPIEPAGPAAVKAQSKPASEYTETRLQLRLPSGPPLVRAFPVETTLFEIAHVIATEKGFSPTTFAITFPRKIWDQSEFGLTLKEAKLVPSAALIVA